MIANDLIERLGALSAVAADPPGLEQYNPDSSAYRRTRLQSVAPMPGIDEFGADVARALGWDPTGWLTIQRPTGGGGVRASAIGEILVAQARFRDARLVLDEFENIVTRNVIEVLEVVPLWGVHPKAVVPLQDKIQLVPLKTVPPSLPRDRYLGIPERSNEMPSSNYGVIPKPRAALTRSFTYGPVLFPKGTVPSTSAMPREGIPDGEDLLDITRSLTAILRRPVFPLAHWHQADESLPLVGGVGGWGGFTIYWPFQSEQDPETLDAISITQRVNAYLSLPKKTRTGLQIALERLRAAQIHSWYHERVMDLGIALEATLFGGDETYTGEIAFRFTVRGTILRGGSPEVRQETASLLKTLYRIRSRVAHGGRSPHNDRRERTQIDDGMALCAELIERIIDHGDRPDWDALVMGWDNGPS